MIHSENATETSLAEQNCLVFKMINIVQINHTGSTVNELEELRMNTWLDLMFYITSHFTLGMRGKVKVICDNWWQVKTCNALWHNKAIIYCFHLVSHNIYLPKRLKCAIRLIIKNCIYHPFSFFVSLSCHTRILASLRMGDSELCVCVRPWAVSVCSLCWQRDGEVKYPP